MVNQVYLLKLFYFNQNSNSFYFHLTIYKIDWDNLRGIGEPLPKKAHHPPAESGNQRTINN